MGKAKKDPLNALFSKLCINANGKASAEKVPEFSKAVHLIVTELCQFYGLSSAIEPVNDKESATHFFLELSDFLREYGCPYPTFSDLPVGERFASVENRTLILRFLCGELAAARKLVKIQPSLLSGGSPNGVINGATDTGPSSAGIEDMDDYLRRACITLKRPKPPADIGAKELLEGLFKSVSGALTKCPSGHLGNPLIPLEGLSDSQWVQVIRMARLLQNEYNSRRETFIKRADCTIESFKWADKSKVRPTLKVPSLSLSVPAIECSNYIFSRERRSVYNSVRFFALQLLPKR
ncbi:unnamed protein product [Dibothriocephalus latus]|uniref:Uncharacterized protein n=1 Tax=Dibothriocephalus latus TaxID=60516 RepID=A0A3P7M646_DIBLA|nr:unnamed protein product [Dibothriocephalus latus]